MRHKDGCCIARRFSMSQNKPLVSVIIPAYNAAAFIAATVDYIQTQTLNNFECIIVNDGSKDSTEKLVKKSTKHDPRFRVVSHQTNKGLSASRNTGYSLASGRFVIFLDADDIFEKDLLQKAAHQAKKTNAEITVFNFREYNMRKQEYSRPVIDASQLPSKTTFTLHDVNNKSVTDHRFEKLGVTVWNKLYERTFLEQHNLLFNEQLHRSEDLEYTIRSFVLAKKITFLSEVLMTYRTEVPSSNQSTLNLYPTDFFDAFLTLIDFFRRQKLYEKYRNDIHAYIVKDICYQLQLNNPESQRLIISQAPHFLSDTKVSSSYLSGWDANTRDMLYAVVEGNYDHYIQAYTRALRDEKEELILRIPPLEERIALELTELNKYRDHPTIKTALRLLQKAIVQTQEKWKLTFGSENERMMSCNDRVLTTRMRRI